MRYREIYLLQRLDVSSVRLRGSAQGREAVEIARQAWGKKLRFCGKAISRGRQGSWQLLEDQFLKDKFPDVYAVGSWAAVIAVALDEQYDDHLSAPFEMGYRRGGPQMEAFLSALTDLDPTFPSWEFPSTGEDDMLNPKFMMKITRYHEAFVKMNQGQTKRQIRGN